MRSGRHGRAFCEWMASGGAGKNAKTREHVLSGRPSSSAVCQTDSFHCPIIRMQKQKTGEHALSDKLAPSAACQADSFYCPIIRV